MKNSILKNQNGFIGADMYISIVIALLASALISILLYNIYIVSTRAKRDSQATSYIIELFEYIDKELYGDVTEENLVEYIDEKYNNGSKEIASARNTTGLSNTDDTSSVLTTPYKIEISIIPFNEDIDVVKTIKVTIKYNVGTKEESISMEKIKSRENLITPNKPEISDIEISSDMKCYPVKMKNSKWYVTNKDDTTWYNYNNKQWATVFLTSEQLNDGDLIEDDMTGNYKIWIPKYAYNNANNKNIVFIYQDTNCYIEDGDLETIDTNQYTIIEGGWIRRREYY